MFRLVTVISICFSVTTIACQQRHRRNRATYFSLYHTTYAANIYKMLRRSVEINAKHIHGVGYQTARKIRNFCTCGQLMTTFPHNETTLGCHKIIFPVAGEINTSALYAPKSVLHTERYKGVIR